MARENAYMILNQYFEDESFLNIALNEQLKKSNLKREDKRFMYNHCLWNNSKSFIYSISTSTLY